MVIFDVLKTTASVLKEANKIEEYKKILDVQEQLLIMQNRIFDLETENRELKGKLETKESLVFENNAYWIDKDGGKDGPFCSCCWDDGRKTIRMQPYINPAYYGCPKCENKNLKIYPNRDSPPRASHFRPNLSR